MENDLKICLIDADSTIPNLALMQLSTHHKGLGDSVKLVKANQNIHRLH